MMCRKKLSFAKRREILSRIPYGVYCYDTNCCPYWEYIGDHKAKCVLLNKKDKYPYALTLLWDQVKVCKYKKRYENNE